jgi:hypothetical protein
MRRRRGPRIVPPPYPGPVVYGGILVGISEEDKAGVPLPPVVYPVMPPDTPPDVIAAMRESGALPPLPTPEQPLADDRTAPPSR